MACKSYLLLLTTSTLFCLLCVSSSLSTSSILQAAEALSHSGFLSMSLTLQLLSNNLTSPSLTIFSPCDSAFSSWGQPSLSHLHFHFSPIHLPPSALNSFPFNSKIPTLVPNRPLTVTSLPSHHHFLSLNGVRINAKTPLYDDGTSFIVFGIADFLDPAYGVSRPSANHKCEDTSFHDKTGAFEEAGGVLRSRGYSFMASFLELQVIGFKEKSLTLFAPVDEAMLINVGNFGEYASLLFRHAVPCKISWSNLIGMDDGVELKTLLKGFKIKVTRSGKVLMVNGVGISFPDLYYSDWLVVHGIRRVVTVTERPQASSSDIGSQSQEIAHDNGHH